MKFSIAVSALFSGVLAAAAPSASNEFVLKAKSSNSAINGNAVGFHGGKLHVSQWDGQHGVNFKGGNGALQIENGDSVYISSDGHLSFRNGAAEAGFSFSGNALQSSKGAFYTCEEERLPSEGEAPPVDNIYVKTDGVTLADNCIEVTLNKASI